MLSECKYCNRIFDFFDECEEHEKTHIQDYKNVDTEEIIKELTQIRENAYRYHVNNMIMGMPVSIFENLLNETVKRLEQLNRITEEFLDCQNSKGYYDGGMDDLLMFYNVVEDILGLEKPYEPNK